jgi:hypothetical protein
MGGPHSPLPTTRPRPPAASRAATAATHAPTTPPQPHQHRASRHSPHPAATDITHDTPPPPPLPPPSPSTPHAPPLLPSPVTQTCSPQGPPPPVSRPAPPAGPRPETPVPPPPSSMHLRLHSGPSPSPAVVCFWLGQPVSSFFAQKTAEIKRKVSCESSRGEELKSGVFLVPAVVFFSATQELQSGQFGLRMEKMAHIKPILCVFGTLFYSSGYTAPGMHHQQANTSQTTHAGAWPV